MNKLKFVRPKHPARQVSKTFPSGSLHTSRTLNSRVVYNYTFGRAIPSAIKIYFKCNDNTEWTGHMYTLNKCSRNLNSPYLSHKGSNTRGALCSRSQMPLTSTRDGSGSAQTRDSPLAGLQSVLLVFIKMRNVLQCVFLMYFYGF